MSKGFGKTILEQIPYNLPKEKGRASQSSVLIIIFSILIFGIFWAILFWFFDGNIKDRKMKDTIPPTQLLGNSANSLGDLGEIEKDLNIPEASEEF